LVAHSDQIQTFLADERYDDLITFLRSLRAERLMDRSKQPLLM
jgi:hypothetical protein